MSTARVVAGTDGSHTALNAVLWASDAAARLDAELVIVHVATFHDRVVGSLGDPVRRALDEYSTALVSETKAGALSRHPDLQVRTAVLKGRPADVLVAESADAALLVVGSRGSVEATVSVLGSVSHRVATHSSCPVVVVPSTFDEESSGAPVVLGAKDSASGRRAARAAADEAVRRGVPLRVVSVSGVAGDGEDDEPLAIEHLVESDRPGLHVDVQTSTGEPGEALLKASADAQLVVLGCRQSTDPWSTRLGPVPTEVLHRSSCPVMLVGA